MKIGKKFAKEALNKLWKPKPGNVDSKEKLSFAKNILRHFNNKSEDFEINQGLIYIWEVFHRRVVKVQSGINSSEEKHH